MHEGNFAVIGNSLAETYECGTSWAIPQVIRHLSSMVSAGASKNSASVRAFEESFAEFARTHDKLRELIASSGDIDLWVPSERSNSSSRPDIFSGSGGFSQSLFLTTDLEQNLLYETKNPVDFYDFFLEFLTKARAYKAPARAQRSYLSFTEQVDRLVRRLQRCFGILLSGLRPVTTEDTGRRHWIASPIAPRMVLPRSFPDSLA